MFRIISLFCILVLGSVASNCAGNQTSDESTQDGSAPTEQSATPDVAKEAAAKEDTGCAPGTPKPADSCIPKCGNELGVGQPCTRGGGECNENKRAILCTGDFDKTTRLVYCTRPCVKDTDCGSNAKCTGNPDNPKAGRGCIPAACLK